MNKTNIATVRQLLEGIENSLRSAKQLLSEIEGGEEEQTKIQKTPATIASGGEKIIEGYFDGELMIGPDGKKYPVPANYASKSKLVEGDILKLTITPDGSFIYKQIGPVERMKLIGKLIAENGQYHVIAGGKSYRVLLASVTYFRVKPGDEVTIIIPKDKESNWAAIENAIIRPSLPDNENEILMEKISKRKNAK